MSPRQLLRVPSGKIVEARLVLRLRSIKDPRHIVHIRVQIVVCHILLRKEDLLVVRQLLDVLQRARRLSLALLAKALNIVRGFVVQLILVVGHPALDQQVIQVVPLLLGRDRVPDPVLHVAQDLVGTRGFGDVDRFGLLYRLGVETLHILLRRLRELDRGGLQIEQQIVAVLLRVLHPLVHIVENHICLILRLAGERLQLLVGLVVGALGILGAGNGARLSVQILESLQNFGGVAALLLDILVELVGGPAFLIPIW